MGLLRFCDHKSSNMNDDRELIPRKAEDILTMLDDEDRPLRDRKGFVRRTLEPGEDASIIAKKLRRNMHMRQADANEFNRRIEYPTRSHNCPSAAVLPPPFGQTGKVSSIGVPEVPSR